MTPNREDHHRKRRLLVRGLHESRASARRNLNSTRKKGKESLCFEVFFKRGKKPIGPGRGELRGIVDRLGKRTLHHKEEKTSSARRYCQGRGEKKKRGGRLVRKEIILRQRLAGVQASPSTMEGGEEQFNGRLRSILTKGRGRDYDQLKRKRGGSRSPIKRGRGTSMRGKGGSARLFSKGREGKVSPQPSPSKSGKERIIRNKRRGPRTASVSLQKGRERWGEGGNVLGRGVHRPLRGYCLPILRRGALCGRRDHEALVKVWNRAYGRKGREKLYPPANEGRRKRERERIISPERKRGSSTQGGNTP